MTDPITPENRAVLERGFNALRYVLNFANTPTQVRTIMRCADGDLGSVEERLEALWSARSIMQAVREDERARPTCNEPLQVPTVEQSSIVHPAPTVPDDLVEAVARAFQAGFEAANAGPGHYGVVSAYRSYLNGIVCGDDDENAEALQQMLTLTGKEAEG